MVFALADPYTSKPLPYADPNRLITIDFGLPTNPAAWASVSQTDVPSLASWQARTDLFDGVAAFQDKGWLRVRLSDRIVPLRAVASSDNLLEVLGLGPRWDASDSSAAWVSHRAATALSGGALQPGRSAPVLPDGVLRVSGLLPPSFLLPEADRTLPVDALVTLPAGPVATIEGRQTSWPTLVARMRPGVTPEIVEAALSASMASVDLPVSVVPLSTALTARLRALATGALLASGLIVLVCWTNVFNIALTRGLYRGPEIATRTALGATPARIVGLIVTDGLKVVALGTVSALAVAWLALAAAVLVLPPQFATLGAPSVTARVALFVVLAGAVAGASWCLASILAWKLGAARQTRLVAGRDGRAIRLVRFVVIAGQLGAASVLLAAAALLGRSYLNLLDIDSGLNERAETLTVVHDPNIPVALRRETVEHTVMALRRAKGVRAAGASEYSQLLNGRNGVRGFVIDGQVAFLVLNHVVGDYFDALGLQFLAGGPPQLGRGPAAVISESTARQYFGGRMPISEILSSAEGPLPITGVVRDVRSRGLALAPKPEVYEVDSGDWGGPEPPTTYVIRVADDSSVQPAEWERIIQRVDPLAIVLDSGTIRELLGRSVRDRTFAALVVGLFAIASLLVTALGLAGVVAYTVVKRTQEIAVRLALGATSAGVTRLVVRDALTAAACGVIGGVIASVWLSGALNSLLYGIRPADPTTLLLTAAILLGIVAGAAILPAIRAARIEPAAALRIE